MISVDDVTYNMILIIWSAHYHFDTLNHWGRLNLSNVINDAVTFCSRRSSRKRNVHGLTCSLLIFLLESISIEWSISWSTSSWAAASASSAKRRPLLGHHQFTTSHQHKWSDVLNFFFQDTVPRVGFYWRPGEFLESLTGLANWFFSSHSQSMHRVESSRIIKLKFFFMLKNWAMR